MRSKSAKQDRKGFESPRHIISFKRTDLVTLLLLSAFASWLNEPLFSCDCCSFALHIPVGRSCTCPIVTGGKGTRRCGYRRIFNTLEEHEIDQGFTSVTSVALIALFLMACNLITLLTNIHLKTRVSTKTPDRFICNRIKKTKKQSTFLLSLNSAETRVLP